MTTSICHRFGRVVRQTREQQHLSQERLAELADLNRSYLGEIERGVVVPSLSTMEKLAGALGVQISSLLAQCEERQVPANSSQL